MDSDLNAGETQAAATTSSSRRRRRHRHRSFATRHKKAIRIVLFVLAHMIAIAILLLIWYRFLRQEMYPEQNRLFLPESRSCTGPAHPGTGKFPRPEFPLC
jgi:hypothetical protein